MQPGVDINKTQVFHWLAERSRPCKWVNTWGMAEIHKRAAEDAVEYSLFPVIPDGKNSSERRKVIEEYVRSFLTFLSPNLINVIWQNEGFNLVPVEEQGKWNRNEPKTSQTHRIMTAHDRLNTVEWHIMCFPIIITFMVWTQLIWDFFCLLVNNFFSYWMSTSAHVWFYTSHQQSFSYRGTGLTGLNQY